jgi:copper chaperone CopZ
VTAEQPSTSQGIGGEEMVHLLLRVPGMTCRDSVRTVTAHLRDVAGVRILNADASTGQLSVTGDVLESDLRRELDRIGFPAAPHTTPE